MSVRLSCSGCGGTVTADDAALRRRLAVCSQCNTILRVEANELVPDREAALYPEAPASVIVDRRGKRDLSIVALRPRGAWAFTPLTRSVGWSAGALAAGLGWMFHGWTAIGLGLPIGLAAFAAASRLMRRHRPVELRGGLLLPADSRQQPIAVTDLQQVYAAVSHFDLGGDSGFSTSNVFALTQSGERVLLVGPVESEQVALYVEHVLESELRLLDLLVMGERGGPELESGGLDPSAIPTPQTDSITCEACGHVMTPSGAEARRGMAECAHCRGLSLLFDLDARMSALGAAGLERRYDIEEDIDGVSITPVEGNPQGGSVEVTGERMVIRQTGVAPITVRLSDVSQISVKEVRSEEDFDLDRGLELLRDATTMSGTVDLRGVILGGAGAVSFRITAHHPSQGEIEIASGLQDPREAFLISRTLSRVLAKFA